MIYVVATASVKPDMRDVFKQGAAACIAATREEEGCLLYDLHESISDPARFVFVEQWTSREALGAHGRAEHMREWRRIVKDCVSAPTKIEIITPANVETL